MNIQDWFPLGLTGLIVLNWSSLKWGLWGLPGGSVVKNLPSNARDMGLIPGLGQSHMPHTTKPGHHNC